MQIAAAPEPLPQIAEVLRFAQEDKLYLAN